jgi:hypothetical protein
MLLNYMISNPCILSINLKEGKTYWIMVLPIIVGRVWQSRAAPITTAKKQREREFLLSGLLLTSLLFPLGPQPIGFWKGPPSLINFLCKHPH